MNYEDTYSRVPIFITRAYETQSDKTGLQSLENCARLSFIVDPAYACYSGIVSRVFVEYRNITGRRVYT